MLSSSCRILELLLDLPALLEIRGEYGLLSLVECLFTIVTIPLVIAVFQSFLSSSYEGYFVS